MNFSKKHHRADWYKWIQKRNNDHKPKLTVSNEFVNTLIARVELKNNFIKDNGGIDNVMPFVKGQLIDEIGTGIVNSHEIMVLSSDYFDEDKTRFEVRVKVVKS